MYRDCELLQWTFKHGILPQNTRQAKGLRASQAEDDKYSRKMLQKTVGLFRY